MLFNIKNVPQRWSEVMTKEELDFFKDSPKISKHDPATKLEMKPQDQRVILCSNKKD